MRAQNNNIYRPCPFQSNCEESGAIADGLNMDKSNYFPGDQQVEEKTWDHSVKMFA